MTSHFPHIARRTVARKQVAEWLKRYAGVAVRLVVGPPGFGKTTAIAAHAEAVRDRRSLYFSIDRFSTSRSFVTSIAQALGERRTISLGGLVVLLAAAAPIDIQLDNVQLAAAELLATINRLVTVVDSGVHFIIASQRRDVLNVGALFAQGLIAVCDQSALALNVAEAQALFASHNITATPGMVSDLVARCEGWPLAVLGVLGVLTEATPRTPSIDAAFDRWRSQWAIPAIDLVTELLERVPEAERSAAQRHFADGSTLDQRTLSVLHRCGFFVRFGEDGVFALMRWVDELYFGGREQGLEFPVLNVRLFGRFAAAAGGTPIVWARRRDQHIVKYLLLRPGASATRAELADVFWPATARPLALQNLRTACSTIRRAIGNAVGIARVDDYFRAGERLVLNRAVIVCDVDRFRRHVESAEADECAGAPSDAIAHFVAAERLYGNGLFAGDSDEPAFAADAHDLETLYARSLTRLSRALSERGSPDLARHYALKAVQLGFAKYAGPTGRKYTCGSPFPSSSSLVSGV